jgi:ABC-type multidrug transport system fused ATPase/permease subunit
LAALRWIQQIAATLIFTARGRFILGICLWALAFVKGLLLPFLIALFGGVFYFRHFVELARQALGKKWPYSLLVILGALFVYFTSRLSSIGANFLIAAITGFHPSIFPNSSLALSLIFNLLLLLVAITVTSGLIALVTGFSDKPSRRVFPITFGLLVPMLAAILPLFVSKTADASQFEQLIVTLDFRENARFQHGYYTGNDGIRYEYGTKVCRHLDFDALIAPIPQGGYVLATLRKDHPVKRQHEAPEHSEPVAATMYVYSRVPQDECPYINEYIEGPATSPEGFKSPSNIPHIRS